MMPGLKSLVPTPRAVKLNAEVSVGLEEMERRLTKGLSSGQVQLFREIAAQMLRNLDEWDRDIADSVEP